MHYEIRRSHRMKKHKFGVTCLGVLFVKSVLVPPEHLKLCVDVSCLECTGMQYVTRRSHRMQKPMFRVTCPNSVFIKSVLVPPEHEK
jgi:hypothetical protein